MSESPASNDAPATDKSPTGSSSRRARRGRRRKPSRPTDNSVDAARSESGLALARNLATRDESVGLLVVGDGANTLGAKAPGGSADGAEEFQGTIDKALAAGDRRALAALGQPECDSFGAAGRGPWQVATAATQGAVITPELRYAGAPFGVGYTVALWDLGW